MLRIWACSENDDLRKIENWTPEYDDLLYESPAETRLTVYRRLEILRAKKSGFWMPAGSPEE